MKSLPLAKTNRFLMYDWDNKLRSGTLGSNSMNIKYDPDGNKIRKESNISGTRKYIVDIVGDLPVILLELEGSTVKKTYIYANSQILAQHDGDQSANRYFYLHDRLGSVRQVINSAGNVVKLYSYEPFGKILEDEGAFANSFMFTGQYRDAETGYDYLRARMYDPYIYRFTSRDPVRGQFREPLTLHAYLYCLNDPINHTDPSGEFALNIADSIITGAGFYGHTINLAAYAVSSGDWKFFDLAEATAKFMKYGMGLAAGNPLGPLARVFIYAGEGVYENVRGSKTGLAWREAAAIDVFAEAAYYLYMWHVENRLGVDEQDMKDFIKWKFPR